MKRYSLLAVLVVLGTFLNSNGHGFDMLTPVEISRDGQWPMFFIHDYHEDGEEVFVKSYDFSSEAYVNRRVEEVASGTIKCYFKLGFDWDTIFCSPLQEFYLPKEKQWVPAHKLKAGDLFLGKDNKLVPLRSIQFVNEQFKIYLIKVAKTQCFFVGKHGVLTHNMAIEASIGLTMAFGEGAAAGAAAGSFWGPITVASGVTIGGLFGFGLAYVHNDRSRNRELQWINDSVEDYIRSVNPGTLEYEDQGLAYRDPWDKNKPKKNSSDKKGTGSTGGFPPNNDGNDKKNKNSRNDDDDPEKNRKINTLSQSEVFKKLKDDYEKLKDITWRRKKGAKGIEDAEYLEWDTRHLDIEAYNKGKNHLGSIDPNTLKLYKGPVAGRTPRGLK